jgi:hypothetical protein
MMIKKPVLSNDFTLEDIRKIRNYYADKYIRDDGSYDFEGMRAETEEGASRVMAEIAQMRAERVRLAERTEQLVKENV